jgi:hypothetical protein
MADVLHLCRVRDRLDQDDSSHDWFLLPIPSRMFTSGEIITLNR